MASVSFFPNSRNITFDGKLSVITAENYYDDSQMPIDSYVLAQVSVAEAMSTSAAVAAMAPPCEPGTRLDVIEKIKTWFLQNDPDKPLMWLTGPAGSGKTAIASALAKICYKEGSLASSFFFTSLTEDKRNKTRLVPSLAYQLWHQGPLEDVIRETFSVVYKHGQSLLGWPLEKQFEELILKPLRNHPTGPTPNWPKVIIIDGLDDCKLADTEPNRNEFEDQAEILALFQKVCADPAFPFRILVTSRPQPLIKRFFSVTAKDISVELFLDGASFNVDADIALFFESQFEILRDEHWPGLPLGWPGEDFVKGLVKASSGNFGFAVSVLSSIYERHNSLQHQLEYLTGLRPADEAETNPWTHFDALQLSVLKKSPKPDVAAQWILAFESEPLKGAPASFVKLLLEAMPADGDFILGNLASIISIPPPEDLVSSYTVYHHCLIDCLKDPKRNKDYFVDETSMKRFLFDRYLIVLKNKGPETGAAATASQNTEFLQRFVTLIPHFEGWTENISPGNAYEPEVYLACDADWWVETIFELLGEDPNVVESIYSNLHRGCRGWPKGCSPACRHWAQAIEKKYTLPQPEQSCVCQLN
ncbi:hypothetical protein D9611_004104 [Ephemerocybe angulata]|uniref:Nephrocystin 3-like N-terminal domain-containing protein n=1 Tax=Ephemerocybe angulata TaxID=980116 RepID=A0A8H5BKB9_9AGAR|nr:hypothetical protein D9611_004104 [Tulosesus angulatus]